jgi:hypothetical protein
MPHNRGFFSAAEKRNIKRSKLIIGELQPIMILSCLERDI